MLRRNVLIFHSGALGDFVLTWPLAAALGRLHPQSRIIFVTHASKGALAGKVLRLDWQDAETGWPALHSDPAAVSDKCRKSLVEAHSIYTFISTPADAWMSNAASLTPDAKFIPLRQAPPDEFDQHATHFLLSQLESAPAVRTAVGQILASIATKGVGTIRSATASAGPILVHPGSGSPGKCWPVEKFLHLIERLSQAGRAVKIVLGEVELERFPGEALRRLESMAPVVKPATYLNLLNELATAAAFVGNDSGPSHLAGIIGVPTLTLFGPTNPAVWRPLGPRVQILARTDLSALEVSEVYDALTTITPR